MNTRGLIPRIIDNSPNYVELSLNNFFLLFSYDSFVAFYDSKTDKSYVNAEYVSFSRTTKKHINHFTNKRYEVLDREVFYSQYNKLWESD